MDRRTITNFLFAGTLALGAAACSEEAETRWEQAGEATTEALESTGRDVRTGAESAARETEEAVGEVGRDVEEGSREATAETGEEVAEVETDLERADDEIAQEWNETREQARAARAASERVDESEERY